MKGYAGYVISVIGFQEVDRLCHGLQGGAGGRVHNEYAVEWCKREGA